MKKALLGLAVIVVAVIAFVIIISPPGPKLVNGEYQTFSSEEGRKVIMKYYDELLSNWKVPFTETDVITSFGTTHVIVAGNEKGKPLVLLHGAGGNAASWSFCVSELSRSYRIYAIDTIGDLGKSRAVKLPKNEKDYADWLNEVFNELKIRKAGVIGLSYGGFLAHSLIAHYPERVDKAVYLAYAYMSEPLELSAMARMIYYSFFPTRENMRKQITWFNNGPIKDSSLQKKFLDYFSDTAKYNSMHLINPTGIDESTVRAIKIPLMIIIGDGDPIYRVDKSEDYCKRVNPGIRFEILKGEGHLFVLSQPERVSGMVLGFLKK